LSYYRALENSCISYTTNINTSKLSSIRAGGYADCIISPVTEDELILTLRLLRAEGARYKVIGGCTNTFFSDEGYRGAIVSTRKLRKISFEKDSVLAQSGAVLSSLISAAADMSASLCSELFGIPGTVGGAVRNNAGAYGRDVSDILLTAELYDTEDEKIIHLDRSDMKFSYRDSLIRHSGLILLSARLALRYKTKEEIRADMLRSIERRRASQPLQPSLGSFFKRHMGSPVSKIIDELGMKGMRVGGASISEKHAGFIVNSDNATACDICELADRVEKIVFAERGITLQREAEYVQ